MSDDQTLEELVKQREMSSVIDLPQLNRAIHRQAVLTVRWCILFHRLNGVVDVDPDNEPPTHAISVDDRGLDYALRWLPPELIRQRPPELAGCTWRISTNTLPSKEIRTRHRWAGDRDGRLSAELHVVSKHRREQRCDASPPMSSPSRSRMLIGLPTSG